MQPIIAKITVFWLLESQNVTSVSIFPFFDNFIVENDNFIVDCVKINANSFLGLLFSITVS